LLYIYILWSTGGCQKHWYCTMKRDPILSYKLDLQIFVNTKLLARCQ